MARLPRVLQKIFGSSAPSNSIAQFGSLAAGTPNFTTNAATIQALGNYLAGWGGAVIGNNSPAIQDMNALFYLLTQQLAYQFQLGVAEWDISTTYYIGSLAQNGSGLIYKSIADNNTGNVLTDTTKWRVVTSPLTTLGDLVYMDSTPQPARLAGNTAAVRKFLRQLGNGTISASPAWDQVLDSDILADTSGSAPANGYLGQTLVAGGSGTPLNISSGGTGIYANFLTLPNGRWLCSANCLVSGSGTAIAEMSFSKKGVGGTTPGLDQCLANITTSGTISFPPFLVTVAPADANKDIGVVLTNYGGSSRDFYPVVTATLV